MNVGFYTYITNIILLMSLIVIFFQLRHIRKDTCDDHEWRRREKALSFSQIHSSQLRSVKNQINASFGYIQSRKDPLSTVEIKEACRKDGSLREEINYLLAYLENIGLACRHNVASLQVVYDLLGNTYLKYYYLFQPLIKESQAYNPRLWQNIEWMVVEITSIKNKKSEVIDRLPKTG